MKKFFKRDCALGIMMLGACALGLTACSSSDNDDSNGGGSVPGGNKSELVQQGKMLLTQIEVESMTYVDKYYLWVRQPAALCFWFAIQGGRRLYLRLSPHGLAEQQGLP